jgi:hypothetical protein
MIKVRLITNSSNGSTDGSLAFWLDAVLVNSSTGLSFINESWAPNGSGGTPVVGSYFNYFKTGSQLSNLSPEAVYQEYRYLNNLGFYASDPG